MLQLHWGQYVSSEAYSWGDQSPVDQAGAATYGITYLLNEWHGLDFNVRADFSEYAVQSSRAQKLSLLPLLTFPRVETRFPLYFGAGLGGGVFLSQLTNKSVLALDYQLVLGARFLELYGSLGTFVEVAMKNSFFVLSTGQFIGSSLATGLMFNF